MEGATWARQHLPRTHHTMIMQPRVVLRCTINRFAPRLSPQAWRVGSSWSTYLKSLFADTGPNGLDATPLEDRTLFSATPLLLGDVNVDLDEDAPQSQLHLPDLFGLDDGGHAVDYQLVNMRPSLFDSLRIDPADNLLIDLAPDEHGLANLVLRAQDGAGETEQLTLRLNVSAVNDTPTMKNLHDFTVTNTAARQTVIDLFGTFRQGGRRPRAHVSLGRQHAPLVVLVDSF